MCTYIFTWQVHKSKIAEAELKLMLTQGDFGIEKTIVIKSLGYTGQRFFKETHYCGGQVRDRTGHVICICVT